MRNKGLRLFRLKLLLKYLMSKRRMSNQTVIYFKYSLLAEGDIIAKNLLHEIEFQFSNTSKKSRF